MEISKIEIPGLREAKRTLTKGIPLTTGISFFRSLNLEVVDALLLEIDKSEIGITEPIYAMDWYGPPREKEVTFKGSLTGPGFISIPIEIFDIEHYINYKEAAWKRYKTLKTRTNILGAYEITEKFTDLIFESVYRLYATTTYLGRPTTNKIVLVLSYAGPAR